MQTCSWAGIGKHAERHSEFHTLCVRKEFMSNILYYYTLMGLRQLSKQKTITWTAGCKSSVCWQNSSNCALMEEAVFLLLLISLYVYRVHALRCFLFFFGLQQWLVPVQDSVQINNHRTEPRRLQPLSGNAATPFLLFSSCLGLPCKNFTPNHSQAEVTQLCA